MISQSIQEVGRGIQRSIARGDYRDLARRLSDLQRLVSEQLASLPANHPSRRELISWALALTDWGSKMISTQRQKCADEKKPLDMIGAYQQRTVSPVRRVCIDL